MDNEDFEEYYRQRGHEISNWLRHELESATVRDGLFVRLLRAKVERKTRRDDLAAQTLSNAVAETRYELEACRDRTAAAVSRVEDQLDRYVDGIREPPAATGEGEIVTVATLTAQNRRLGEVLRLRQESLENSLADVRSAQSRVDVERCENDRIKILCSTAATHD